MPEPQSIDLNPEIRRIVDAARGVWTRRLIDQSRANSLLFYRDLKVGTLDLTAETRAVVRLLAGDKLTVESRWSRQARTRRALTPSYVPGPKQRCARRYGARS